MAMSRDGFLSASFSTESEMALHGMIFEHGYHSVLESVLRWAFVLHDRG